jgi:hypothetical protein
VAQFLQRQPSDHQNLILAQLWKSLKQHRENHRLQIPSARQDPPAVIWLINLMLSALSVATAIPGLHLLHEVIV